MTFITIPAGALRQLLCLVPVLLLSSGCGTGGGGPHSVAPGERPDAAVAWEDTLSASHADGFRLDYREGYKLLEVLNPYQDRTDTISYALVPRSAPSPPSIPERARRIPIPIRSLIATSTTHVALTGALNAHDILEGMVGAGYLYDPEVRDRVESGEITPFPQGEFNKEQALAIGPDLVMVSAGQSSQFDDYRVLLESGIPVMINAEWLETTPLGKAEWIKVMGALLNRESRADSLFKRVEARYQFLLERVKVIEDKPLVINNIPYKGAWFVSAGESFTANYFRDAGADYPWFGTGGTGGLRLNFEEVYEIGLRADVWLNPGAAQSLDDIRGQDPRFREFRPVRNGRVYNNNRRLSPNGGNDFWESGVIRPDRVLADLIDILHPGLLGDHELFYYRKLE